MVSQLEFVTPKDLIVVPVLLVVATALVGLVCARYYKNTLIGQLIWTAYIIKLILIGLRIYLAINVFEIADTFYYYAGTHGIYEAFQSDPLLGAELIFDSYENYSMEARDYAFRWLRRPNTGMVIRISGVISLFTFNSFIAICFVFGLMAFGSSLLVFEAIRRLYPTSYLSTAIACFLMPSVLFWSSLISKDALAFFALGVLVFCMFEVVYRRSRSWIYWVIAISMGYLLFVIKAYLLFIFIIALILPLAIKYKIPVQGKGSLLAIRGIAVSILAAMIFIIVSWMGSVHTKYSEDKLMEFTEELSVQQEVGGSSYTVGLFSTSPAGVALGALQAAIISLYRPGIWEARSLLLVPAAFENLIMLLVMVYVLFRVGAKRLINIVARQQPLMFMFLFVLLLAIMSGLFSWNFGSLVRYRMPYVPLYMALLGIVLTLHFPRKARIVTAN